MQDTQLLEEFIEQRSSEAFAGIVRRYSGMVYASALRQAGDAHLAEEIAQGVFVDLWRCAGSMKRDTVLVGWLITATRYRAHTALKLRRRRQRHETQAAQLRKDSVSQSPQPWLEEVAPHFDAALASLSSRNRQALLLRFFEGASTRAVSQRLGISEEAARQRVSRSLEQLRAFFARRGVALPAAAVPLILASQANLPPVAGLVQSTISAVQTSVPKGMVISMAASKVKVAVGSVVLLALVGGGTGLAWRVSRHESPIVIETHPTLESWRENFNQVYGLGAGQQVKYVPPPFVAARNLFWMAEQRRQGAARPEDLRGNESLTVEWDGPSPHWRSVTLLTTLGAALQNAAGIRRADLDASVPASMPLEGDWVVRKGATADQVAQGIAAVLSQKLQRTVRLERRSAEHDTIVVRGTYRFTPLAGKPDNGVVELIGDPPPRNLASQIQNITLGELLAGLAQISGLSIIDETGESSRKVTIADHPSYGNPEAVLRNVAAQTSLRLDHEARRRELWFMLDATAGK